MARGLDIVEKGRQFTAVEPEIAGGSIEVFAQRRCRRQARRAARPALRGSADSWRRVYAADHVRIRQGRERVRRALGAAQHRLEARTGHDHEVERVGRAEVGAQLRIDALLRG